MTPLFTTANLICRQDWTDEYLAGMFDSDGYLKSDYQTIKVWQMLRADWQGCFGNDAERRSHPYTRLLEIADDHDRTRDKRLAVPLIYIR